MADSNECGLTRLAHVADNTKVGRPACLRRMPCQLQMALCVLPISAPCCAMAR